MKNGVGELDEDKLPLLLNLKYNAMQDAEEKLGDVSQIRSTFFDCQKNLYTSFDFRTQKTNEMVSVR